MAFYFPFAKIWPGISVLPACLPPAGHVSDYGEKLAVTGFGFTKSPIYDKDKNLLNSAKRSRYLKVAYVDDYSDELDPTKDLYCNRDTKKFICAINDTEHMVNGQPTKFLDSACETDIGGPLHYTNSDGKTIVIGVALGGEEEWVDKEQRIRKECTKMQSFIRVTAQKDWILSIVGKWRWVSYCEIRDYPYP